MEEDTASDRRIRILSEKQIFEENLDQAVQILIKDDQVKCTTGRGTRRWQGSKSNTNAASLENRKKNFFIYIVPYTLVISTSCCL